MSRRHWMWAALGLTGVTAVVVTIVYQRQPERQSELLRLSYEPFARLSQTASRRLELQQLGCHPMRIDLECERWKAGDSFDELLIAYSTQLNRSDDHYGCSALRHGEYGTIRVAAGAKAGWEFVARKDKLVAARSWAGLVPTDSNWTNYYFNTMTREEWREYEQSLELAWWEEAERAKAPLRAVVGVPVTVRWAPPSGWAAR